ncbi:hypothetical protein Tco_0668180 [Tanacetum coccineum]
MSGSEPGEMAPESSKAVVLPKFDMHIHTSELTSAELKMAVEDYCIPLDLDPRLPPPDLTMKRLPSKAISDAMPWRHGDTDLHDDFPTNYNDDDVSRLSDFLVPLRPPPRHLLYMCGLTTACRNLELSYNIKDRDKNELVSHLATPRGRVFLGNLSKLRLVTELSDTLESQFWPKEKELLDMVKNLERERDEWRETASGQVEKIQGLEEKVGVLEREKLVFSDKVVQADADRKKLVREFILVKRLHMSVEYRQSLAAPVSSCFTAGWLGGLSLGRTEEQITQILSESKDLDIEGSKTWEDQHPELFTKSYPYIQKIADSYNLLMSELLKVTPDVPPTDKGPSSSAPKPVSDAPFGTTT